MIFFTLNEAKCELCDSELCDSIDQELEDSLINARVSMCDDDYVIITCNKNIEQASFKQMDQILFSYGYAYYTYVGSDGSKTKKLLYKKFQNVPESLKEEFGVDFDDTLAWVEKKRPDLSRGAQIKFARNIIAKRQREAIKILPPDERTQPAVESREPVYQIWGDYDKSPYDAIRPSFCYAHGDLESDMRFDVFTIESSFDVNMADEHFAKLGKYKCIYKGKYCTFEVFIQRGMPFGLCYYDDDIEAKEYVEREKRNPRR